MGQDFSEEKDSLFLKTPPFPYPSKNITPPYNVTDEHNLIFH